MVYGFGGLVSEERPDGPVYVQGDQVGSPNILTNASGVVVGRSKNLPFGERFGSVGYRSSRRYTNHEETEDYAIYMQARTYLPAYGKFAQVDPAYDQTKDDPETWNLYNYCTNNPVTHTDPDGRYGIDPNEGWRPGGQPKMVWDEAKKPAPAPTPDQAQTNTGGDSNKTSPWKLGWQWLTGTGPRDQKFGDGDPMTVQLQQHKHIQETRDLVATNIATDGPLQGRNDYKLGGLEGVPKYTKDYSTLLTGGLTGNLAVTYLGSYGLKYNVTNMDPKARTASVTFTAWNSSTISSATHPPVIGYTPAWNRFIGVPLDNAIKTGPLSRTTQTFVWTESIKW